VIYVDGSLTPRNPLRVGEPLNPRLLVTVDVEEEGLFSGVYRPCGNTVENTRGLERFQAFCDDYTIRPTYLVDTPVIEDHRSAQLLRTIQDDGRCEVGAHLHPWCTPPFKEQISRRNTFMCNLPQRLQREKLAWLTGTIEQRFGRHPTSFRAGRLGLDLVGARMLHELSYIVDSSVLPFSDLSAEGGPNFCSAPYTPYYLQGKDLCEPHTAGFLLEAPISGGYNWLNFGHAQRVRGVAASLAPHSQLAVRILNRSGMVRYLGFLPEQYSAAQMRRLVDTYLVHGAPCMVMMLHSSSLAPGYSPFVPNPKRLERLYRALAEVFEYCQYQQGMVSQTLTAFAYTYAAGADAA
jgi:hypothetical protein